jgi:molybdate transport system substrate-binding protein
MKNAIHSITSAIALLAILQAHDAQAADIKLLAAFGVREVVEDLGPKFERATGHKLTIVFGNLGALVKLVTDGETADLVILPQQGAARFVQAGKARAENVVVIARGGLGVAVRKGAARPDISTPDQFKRALLASKSITYLDPAGGGVSGTHFVKVLDRLGIADEMKSKTVLHRNSGEAAAFVAGGKAEIGVNLIQELLPKAGIDVVGPLPGDLQYSIVYSAVTMAGAQDGQAAKALVEFLRTPDAASTIKAKGMEPG